jgi:hypothetical protein
MLPSEFQEAQSHPNLRLLLAEHIDMQFDDLRAVLRLPAPEALGSPAGGNFIAASALLAAVSGCSVLFLRAGSAAFKPPFDSKGRFRDALGYMPWDAKTSGLQKGAGIKRLYSYARNPLAHAFGVTYHPGKATAQIPNVLQWSMAIQKTRLSLAQIHELEGSTDRPEFVGPPLKRVNKKALGQPERLVLDVGGLYWGLHRMLHELFADPREVAKAEEMARRFLAASFG